MKINFKKNQVVIFVVALMLVAAGYLNYTTGDPQRNLIPTSALADSEQMASIGDATLVSANGVSESAQNGNQNTETLTNGSSISSEKNTENSQNQENMTSSTVENETEGKPQSTNTQPTSDNYFAQSKLDRDTMYSQMLANYQTILESSNVAADEKKTAQAEIKRINSEKNAIMIAENLIKTKGFADVILFVNNGNVSAVVKAEKLETEQVAQLQNIITRELSVQPNKINVSSKM
ncbi:MAG: SpoIIIAH-like family protein [Clostridia bacterium]|nr:SpoIIIAH-like family protein [Clostridia bacterium]